MKKIQKYWIQHDNAIQEQIALLPLLCKRMQSEIKPPGAKCSQQPAP
jgi:hypothetical protein